MKYLKIAVPSLVAAAALVYSWFLARELFIVIAAAEGFLLLAVWIGRDAFRQTSAADRAARRDAPSRSRERGKRRSADARGGVRPEVLPRSCPPIPP